MMFVLPAGHRLARKKAISQSNAAYEPIILPARESQPIVYQTYCRMIRDAGFEPVVSIDVLTIDDLLAVVAAGAGIGKAPIVPGLRYPGVVLRHNSPEYLATYELAWIYDHPAVRDLLSFVRVEVASQSSPASLLASPKCSELEVRSRKDEKNG